MKSIAVLTSGGDSPGMNACIRSIVRYGISQGLKIYGVARGYSGLVENEIVQLTERSVGNIIHTGGTILKTSRCKEFMTPAGVDKAAANLKSKGIDGLIVIGGDGTMRGARELQKRGIKVACAPGTIDNNLYYTDYTIGYDTAVNTVVDLVNNVRNTSISHDRVSIIETMGAGCGDVALNSGLAAGADVILVPEVMWSIDDVCQKLSYAKKHKKQCSIIVVSEHVCDPNDLAKMIQLKSNIECRTVILGHVQRGGTPTAFDRNLASLLGAKCVEMLLQDECGVAGFRNGKVIFVSIDEALSGTRKFDMQKYNLAQRLSF